MQMLTFFSLGIQCNVEVQSEGEEGSIRKSVAKKETWQCLECDFFFFFFDDDDDDNDNDNDDDDDEEEQVNNRGLRIAA